MLGEVALYSFVILVLSGTFLTFFYQPSMAEVHYDGSYAPLKGAQMSIAYASSLDISFDIRGGLIMRQVHHWAALLFVLLQPDYTCFVCFSPVHPASLVNLTGLLDSCFGGGGGGRGGGGMGRGGGGEGGLQVTHCPTTCFPETDSALLTE